MLKITCAMIKDEFSFIIWYACASPGRLGSWLGCQQSEHQNDQFAHISMGPGIHHVLSFCHLPYE